MMLSWTDDAWDDYCYWQNTDKKHSSESINHYRYRKRQPFSGLGEPEPLKHNWSGYWSRRIDREHRIIYKALDKEIIIVQCRYHY